MANSTSWEKARENFEWAVQWRSPGGKIYRYRYATRSEAAADMRGYGEGAYIVHKDADGEWYRASA